MARRLVANGRAWLLLMIVALVHRADSSQLTASTSRRIFLRALGTMAAGGYHCGARDPASAAEDLQSKRTYFQRFPTLFAPLYGDATKQTIRRQLGENV